MSFPAYEFYKESGVDWLGAVPEDWKVLPLHRVIRDQRRITYGIVQPGKLDETGRYMVRGQDYSTVWGKPETLFRVSDEIETPYKRSRLMAGDIVITIVGAGVGNVATIPEWLDGANITQTTARLSIDPDKAYSQFISFVLQSSIGRRCVELYSKGAAQPGLNLEHVRTFPVTVPSLDEQKAISSFLDVETSKIDGLVSEQRRLIELLKEKRQAVISHAVTKGLNPNAPMKPSGIQWLGDVPQHWEVQRIKHAITSIEQGWSPQCEISPVENESQWGVLKVGCVNYGKFTAKQNKALPAALEPKPELGIKKDDLLISRANTIELVGSATVVESDHDRLMLCDKLYRLRMDSGKLLPTFLCYFLTCELAREPIELGASGASPSMKNIAQSVILELWFASPDVEEQAEIVDAIRERWNAITSLIAEAERAIELLQERRTALISAAVTGKIDVREFTSCERQGASRRPVRATKQNEAK